MTTKFTKAIFLYLISVGMAKSVNGQNAIYFNYNDGTQNIYALQDVRKLDFNGDDINLHLNDGSIFTWNVSTVGYYQYSSSTQLNVEDFLHEANDWDVFIFPNPSDGHQTLKLKLPQATELSFSILDISGKQIFQQQIGPLSKGEHLLPLDWSNAADGSYCIVLNSKDFAVTKKIIKK
jgi:Secretion system C-terminal sorting domain